jgi:hypothetical protein
MMNKFLSGKAWWLIVLWMVGGVAFFKPWVHGTDPVGYYSWLHTVVIDGNLDTTNEYDFYDQEEYGFISPGPTGLNRNPYAIGSAILWSPFFLTAHVISKVLQLPADGYALPYVFAASFGSAFYALLGLWLSYRLARELFGARPAMWATIGIWWATPLLFYMFGHPLMSHANDAFVNALFVFVWWRTRQPITVRGAVLRGAALGLAMLVRTQNALLLLLPISEVLLTWLIQRRVDWRPWLKPMALLALTATIVFAPQLIVWQQTYGAFWPGNPYSITYGDSFNPASPHFFDVLLSSARGLFLWSPLVLLAIIGLFVFVLRAQRTLGVGLILVWLAQVYLIGGWNAWSGAASFGQRFMINGTVTYVLGLAALLAWLQTKISWKLLGTVVVFFVVWNLLLLAQYITELLPRAGYVDVGQMLTGQVRVIGVVLERLTQLLEIRFGRTR